MFEREVQKFQKEMQHELDKHKPRTSAAENREKVLVEGEAEETFPDIDQVLKDKKKKLVIRMKNYRFSSVNDIFEARDTKHKDAIHSNINFTQKA